MAGMTVPYYIPQSVVLSNGEMAGQGVQPELQGAEGLQVSALVPGIRWFHWGLCGSCGAGSVPRGLLLSGMQARPTAC